VPSDAENIIELLGPREVIGQAIDVLMLRDALSRDDAFQLLVLAASDSRRKVVDTAADIIEQRKDD
jgi:AmiR/NasT family two-component response regulator